MQNAVLQMSSFHKPLRKRPSRITKSLETILTNAVTEHLINGAETTGYPYRRGKKTSITYITPSTKINSRCVKDLHVKNKTSTNSEEEKDNMF